MALEDPHTPFQMRADASLVDGQFNASASFGLPDDTLFVAQFVSLHVMLPPGQTPQASFNASGGAVGGFIPLQSQGTTATPFGPLAVFVAATGVLDYATGFFSVDLSRSAPTTSSAPGEARLSAFVSGFTVPA
jgi:hypothetical protein